MTFQRRTALRLIGHIRQRLPHVRVVVGGYDPSLAPEAYAAPGTGVDVIVRGEGDLTFRELVRSLERGASLASIPGLSWRTAAGRVVANPDRAVSRLRQGELALPKRSARVFSGYTMLGRPVDVVETSRGCTFDCSFCSIIEMRGRNFHTLRLRACPRGHRATRRRTARARSSSSTTTSRSTSSDSRRSARPSSTRA